jgi:hypothetical protein
MGHLRVDIDRVIDIINKEQKLYPTKYLTSIPNLGKSDLEGYAYSDKLLFEKLNPHIAKENLTLGITSVQLQKDWWIRPDPDRSGMIITTFQADSLIEKARRTMEDFVAFKIVTCILTSEYFRKSKKSPYENLLHDDCRGCLFDFCPDKEDRVQGLRELYIDAQCEGTLLTGNVPTESIEAIKSVMKYMKKPTLGKTAYSVQKNPYLAMIFGMGIGILVNTIANLLLQTDNLRLSFSLVLLFTIGTLGLKYLYDRIKS